MDCARVDLVGYHFGLLEEDARAESGARSSTRDDVEAHLKTCGRCLDAYLALKHHEDDAREGARPSEEARLKLRRDVARTFARPAYASWLARPVPLYQGLAIFAVGVVLAAAAGRAQRPAPPAPVVLVDGPSIDTARPHAESLALY